MASATFLMALLRDNLRMGPIVNARMTAAALMGLPYGVAFAGAQATIQAVEAGSAEGAAHLTAHLVDLGYERLVVWVVLNLVDRDRADIVVKVSSQMIAQGYASQTTVVTKELLAQERADAGASIAGEMLKNGNTEFMTIYKAATKTEGAEDVAETEQEKKGITQKLKEGLASVTDNAEESKQEAREAEVEGSKTLQDKAKEKTERVGDMVRGALNS